MARTKRTSPCCGARLIVCRISVAKRMMVFRCKACPNTYVELFKDDEPPKLRLVHSR